MTTEQLKAKLKGRTIKAVSAGDTQYVQFSGKSEQPKCMIDAIELDNGEIIYFFSYYEVLACTADDLTAENVKISNDGLELL